MTVRARFDGTAFVPIDPVDFAKDQVVELEIRAMGPLRKGSAALLRELMKQGTPLEPGDAAALEASIESGKRPLRFDGAFDTSDQ